MGDGSSLPAVLLLGGDDGASTLSDARLLTLRALDAESYAGGGGGAAATDAERAARCGWRLVAGTANATWFETCGAPPGGGGLGDLGAPCAPLDLLRHAWCLEQYQSINSFYT